MCPVKKHIVNGHFLIFLFSLAFCSALVADQHSSPVNDWDYSNQVSNQVIDHTLWQSLLNTYLDQSDPSAVNLFNYAAVNKKDRQQLDRYLSNLEKVDPSQLSRAEQKAYWINFYNALTIKVVLEEYPVDSIKKVGSFFNLGPWDNALVKVNQRELSLNDIEHGILRPIFQDPRIHYAVNCASYSCPNLLDTAFTAANTESLLETAAKDYINHPRGVSLQGQTLRLSSIFDWYAEDFGNDEQDLLAHLRRYATPELSTQLKDFEGDIDYHYDWSLNDTP